jgi:hypothetical protein
VKQSCGNKYVQTLLILMKNGSPHPKAERSGK